MKESRHPKKKWSIGRAMFLATLAILSIAAILLYTNFNRLLSEAVMKNFNANIISDVYELKFEKLSVNPFVGSMSISNVTFVPREKPLADYPYINSSMRVAAKELRLENVALLELLQENKLAVDQIVIANPEVELLLAGAKYVLLPFHDSTTVASQPAETKKKSLGTFHLNQFQLIDAAFHVTNTGKQREFRIKNFTITLDDLQIGQEQGKYSIALQRSNLALGEFEGHLKKGPLQKVSLKNLYLKVDSLDLQKTMDTLTYRFNDVSAGLQGLDIQTADSISHIAIASFDLSYLNKSIKLNGITFKPNVSELELQKKYTYQHTSFSGTVGALQVVNVDFDSLIHHQKIRIDEITLDSVTANIFKDKVKPIDTNKFPVYLGQTIAAIQMPLTINHVKATHMQLINTERKPDSTMAKVTINKASLEVHSITNRNPKENLVMTADAYIEGKAHFKAKLEFHYQKPRFDFEAKVDKFSLTDLNPLVQAYTPAKFISGTADAIAFSGVAEKTKAAGTMKFLYHDLEIDLKLKDKAKWKSSIIAFTANSVIDLSNPTAADLPPRVVKFQFDRDMNKGFVNVIIKSLLNGLKETMIMSKENRKAYVKAKEQAKEKNK